MILKQRKALFLAVVIAAVAAPLYNAAAADNRSPSNEAAVEKLNQTRVPFVKNSGQFPDTVSFYARLFSGSVFVTDNEFVYTLSNRRADSLGSRSATVLRERPLRASVPLQAAVDDPGSAVVNYYTAKFHSAGIPTAGALSLGQVWPGISLKLSARNNNIEKIFTVAPGTDPSNIAFTIDGAVSLTVAEDGRLIIATAAGDISMTAPVAYQISGGKRTEVRVSYTVTDTGYSFAVGDYDHSLPLIIDPLLASTFIGGEAQEFVAGMKLDSIGNVIITGWTDSIGYPTTPGAYDIVRNISREAFVTKIRSDLGAVQYSTYFGGSGFNTPASVELDGNSNIIVTGWTDSADYPTTIGAYDSTVSHRDLFVSKFSANLGQLTASTVYGGSGDDHGSELALAGDGTIYLVGHTLSQDIETTAGSYDSSANGVRDAFVVRFSSDLSTLLAATYLGGSGEDEGFAIAISSGGDVYVGGDTVSADFPKTGGAFDTTAEGREVFISRFNSSLQTLVASTLLGGTSDDQAYAMAFAPNGDLYLTGDTLSGNFPATAAAFDKTINGARDVFVGRVSPDLSTLIAATFVGGSVADYGRGMAIDGQSNILITGATSSSNFPTTPGSYDRTFGGGSSDAFIAKLSPTLSQLSVATYVGGSDYDNGARIALDSAANITVAGNTISLDFPTVPGGYDTVHDDARSADGFILKIGNSLSGGTLLATNVDSTSADGIYAEGASITISIRFTEPVNADTSGGLPRLTLNSGGTALYSTGSGTDTLLFTYPVLTGQTSNDLDYSSSAALTLNGATIKSVSKAEIADLTLPPPGAIGSLGANRQIVIDTQVSAPVITSPAQNLVTNNPLIPVQGTAEIGSTVTVLDGTTTLGAAVTDASGQWKVTPAIAMIDGTHTFTATALDLAFHTSSPSAARVIVVDTTPPVAPVILAPAADAVFTQRLVPVAGTATGEAGATITVYIDDAAAGTATVDQNGSWSFSNPTQLVNGPHTAAALTTDKAGNAGPRTAAVPFTVNAPVDTDGDGLTDALEQQLGTNPLDPDTDHDGGSDGQEHQAGSDPLNPASTLTDFDGDGLSNTAEASHGTDPNVGDSDHDGASDGAEVQAGSDPLNPVSTLNDLDGDGLSNTDEAAHGTDPNQADTDHDGASDSAEITAGSNPTNPSSTINDLDGDGLSNADETAHGTDPRQSDTDHDGYSDGAEVAAGSNPTSSSSTVNDFDGDGLSNNDEAAHGTDPHQADTDHDGSPDGAEVAAGSNPLNPSSTVNDIDGDGLSNDDETAHGTDPHDSDSDHDGASDGQEVREGTDPNSSGSTPPNPDGGGPSSSGSTDSDNDGITDAIERINGTDPFNADTDNDSVSDRQEQLDGTDPLDRGSVLTVLSTTVCSEWNGFLGMFNIMEHVNMSGHVLHIQTTLYSIDGIPQSTQKFEIAPGAQFDLLVHDMGGRIADSYGKVCSTHDGIAGDLDGRMSYYKQAPSGEYEFAFAMAFSNGIKGAQSVPFNTYQPSFAPSEANNPVANWIQLTNSSTDSQSGTLSFYSAEGLLLAEQRIELPGGARRDFSGHQFGRNLVGTAEWKPDSQAVPFLLRNVRYYYATPDVSINTFSSAAQFSAQPGSGRTLVAPLNTNGSSAIVEISNVAQQNNSVTADVYNAAGQLLQELHLDLAPHASFHLISDSLLNGAEGIAVVRGSIPSGLIATAMHYGRDSSLALQYMYGVQATETLGVNLRGSYNTFLSQQCSLLLMNPDAVSQAVTIGTTRYDGTRTLGNGVTLTVPGHGLLDFNLCNKDLADVYGVVTVQPQQVNLLAGTVVRAGPFNQYRFPTELRQ